MICLSRGTRSTVFSRVAADAYDRFLVDSEDLNQKEVRADNEYEQTRLNQIQKENEKMQKKKEEKKMNHLYLEKQMREKDERQKQTREIDLKEGAIIQILPKHVINIFPRIIETPEHVRMQRKRGNVNNFKQQLDMQVRA